MRPDAVVFDWDNTLVDSWLTIHDALNQTFAVMQFPAWTLEETKARTRHSLRESFPKLFGDSWQRAQRTYLEAFEAIHIDRLRPIAGAEGALAALGDAGIYAAVVSNKTGRLLRREVAALGWDRFFGTVIGAGDAPADKPDRAPIDLSLVGSGVSAGESVWYVGDTDVDIECALNAGCVPVLIHAGGAEASEETGLVPTGARYRLTDFAALAALLGIGRHSTPCR